MYWRSHRISGVRYAAVRAQGMLICLNKPFGVLSQFRDRSSPARRTLAEFSLPAGVYPAGRLDHDSEGLLLLTDDGALAHRLTDPRHKQPKTYWVQVEGTADDIGLSALRAGVVLNDGITLPAQARVLEAPPSLWPRDPPVRFRKTVPDTWIELTIREGRNRQVRRMTAALGLPTLRLVRVGVGDMRLEDLSPGTWRVSRATGFTALRRCGGTGQGQGVVDERMDAAGSAVGIAGSTESFSTAWDRPYPPPPRRA